jgi:ELWxxDGT repeat protein
MKRWSRQVTLGLVLLGLPAMAWPAPAVRLLKDIVPGPGHAFPNQLTAVGNTVFFTVQSEAAEGAELWKTDGTPAGTVLVKDINPGPASSWPGGLVSWNGLLFFYAEDVYSGRELWRSDGTAAGTYQVLDVAPGRVPGLGGNARHTPFGGALYFSGNRPGVGRELWKTDGTAAGTVLVKDIEPGAASSMPTQFTATTTGLYLLAQQAGTTRLWRTDGTEVGTVEVRPPGPFLTPGALAAQGPLLLFRADDGVHGAELWRTDGTPEGTVMVKDARPGPGALNPVPVLAENDVLFFTDGERQALWKSDGTEAGTVLLHDFGNPEAVDTLSPTRLGSLVVFRAGNGQSERELWRTDGTPAGTVLLKDINPGHETSGNGPGIVLNGRMYFAAGDQVRGFELWTTDGTTSGTYLVEDTVPGSADVLPHNFAVAGERLVFTARDSSTGYEVWGMAPTQGQSAVVLEGDAGIAPLVFTVTLPAAEAAEVEVAFQTDGGTATAGVDFVPSAGTLTFPPGQTSGTVTVPVRGETAGEFDESILLRLTGWSNGRADGLVTGVIVNDDAPGVTVEDAAFVEPRWDWQSGWVTLRVFPPTGQTVTVQYDAADGTATRPGDYGGIFPGSITFPPGVTERSVEIIVAADDVHEGPEAFTLNLAGVTGAAIADGQGSVRILDPQVAGDLDRDGHLDLVWHRAGTGDLRVWFMSAFWLRGSSATTPGGLPDTRWQVAGVNDFNADHKPDLLWRHRDSGQIALWYLDETILAGGGYTNPSGLADLSWHIAATGDYNADGMADLLWQNDVSGQIALWYMNGATLTSGTFTSPSAVADTGWRIVGTGDFNLDGQADILWRHATSGEMVVWHMEGSTLVRAIPTNPSALADPQWEVSATGDFDGDARTDIVWHHATSGQVVLWLMDGLNLRLGGFTSPGVWPDAAWRIVGPR